MSDNNPPAISAAAVDPRKGSNYPADLAKAVAGRAKRVLGDRFGLSQFGVNHVTLEPGAQSSHRHWHEQEDEFVYVLEGTITLLNDAGEHLLTPGMCAGFKAGVANGHCLVNRSDLPVTYLEVGTRSQTEVGHYPEVDLRVEKKEGKWTFTRKDGSPL
jgi:uncharacterized cupin superfamily protein